MSCKVYQQLTDSILYPLTPACSTGAVTAPLALFIEICLKSQGCAAQLATGEEML